ncbi:MAG TPA: hypothetical protein VGF88_18865 [Acidobacteriaceae bacterium]|jgi:hypothetical protein
MGAALINEFLQAKMQDVRTSAALYSVSSDVDGAKIVHQTGARSNKAIVGMLATTSDRLTRDPQLVASMVQATMVGVSRRLLESAAPEKHFESARQELLFLVRAYLEACTRFA